MSDAEEKAWMAGNRAAWARLLDRCLAELGQSAPDAARLVAEREAAVVALRIVCEDFGDNDWEDNLHLADVIEKHLHRHLAEEET